MAEELDKALTDALKRELRRERELSKQLSDFVGEWVAVTNERVVAHADTLESLLKEVDPEAVEAIFEVADEQGVASFF